MTDHNNVYKIPVFGESGGFQDPPSPSLLGRLYDVRQEKVLPEVRLWAEKTMSAFKTEQSLGGSVNSDVVPMESWSHKLKSLNVPEQMRLSVLTELVDLKRFGNFFKEEKEYQRSIKLSIILEKPIRLEGIPKHLLAIKSLDFPEMLSKEQEATHVIVGVQNGRRAMINMEMELKEDQEPLSCLGELKTLARKVSKVTLEEMEKYTSKELEMLKKVKWTAHGDGFDSASFKTFEEIRSLCKELHEDIDNQVPTQIWLMPLAHILSKLPKFKGLNNDLVNKTIQQVEFTEEMKQKVRDLCKLKSSQEFPNFKKELEKFLVLLDENISEYKRKLKKSIEMIKNGSGSEEDIFQIIKCRNGSPFAQQSLEKWVKKTQEISTFLINVINILTNEADNIHISPTQKENGMQNSSVAFVLCIDSLLTNDTFLSQMEDFTRKGITLKTYANSLMKKTLSEAFQIAKSFKNFAMANKEDPKITFIATEKDCSQLEDADLSIPICVKMFVNGKENACPTLPSKPENVTIEDVSHQMIKISWEEPSRGSENIVQYLLTATETSYTQTSKIFSTCNKNEELQITLVNLHCGSTYNLALQGSTSFGLSPVYNLQVKTLVAGPPLNLRAVVMEEKGFLVHWNSPDVKQFDINIIGYLVRLDVQNDEEGCLDHLKDDVAQTGDGFEILHEICPQKTYFITVTTMTDKSKGYHSKIAITMQQDTDFLAKGFQSMADSIKISELVKINTSTQVLQILNHLFSMKQEVESVLLDKSKVSLLVQEIMSTQEFNYFLGKVKQNPKLLTNSELEVLQIIKRLLLPFSEDALPKGLEELRDFIAFLKNNVQMRSHAPNTVQEVILAIVFQNRTKSLEMDELTKKIEVLISALKSTEKIPLIVAIETILCSFGYDIKSKKFKTFLNPASVGFLIEKLHYITLRIQGANEFVDIEMEVLLGFLEIEKYPKNLFETYLCMKEKIWPTTIVAQLKKYLQFWKDEEIKNVLEALQNNEDVEKLFCQKKDSSIKRHKIENFKFHIAENNQFLPDHFLKEDQNKLHREDVFSIDLFQSEPTEMKGEKHLKFLKQLLSLDYHCRNQGTTKNPDTNRQPYMMSCNDDDDFFSNIVKTSIQLKKPEKEISNADLVNKTISICDPFLLQDVYDKMTSCQLAVPLICPKENNLFFNLWATRTVRKKWVNSSSGQELQVHDQFIANKKMGTISFCRIGKTRVSKSKLANLFLSSVQGWPDHSHFLHRDIDSDSKLNRGSIETCWYCPEGRPREHLKDIHNIYNLRGDARENKKQFQFLLGVSSVVVILMDNAALQQEEIEMLKSMDDYVVLVNLSQDGVARCMGKKIWLNALNMNPKELSEALIEHIPSVSQNLRSLEDHAIFAQSVGMEVDENNEACQVGKKAAQEFMLQLQQYDITNLKSNVVPLQGKLWHQWGKLDKEESRQQFIGDSNPQKYSSDLRDKKKELRERQFEQGATNEIQFFVEKILKFRNTLILRYFIAWCQMFLNEMSEKYLPTILRDYNCSAKELAKLVKQLEGMRNSMEENNLQHSLIQSLIDQEKKNIKKLSEQFTIASFGIEHVFRELSQVYESYEYEDQRKAVSSLPKLMADLFIMGYPLEIMDGDASHVPLTWIKQVLLEVKKKLGRDAHVFVLSILGIQSSGKSTLLNTMFGSKFAVSSGRCTKGVFLQLIPVSSNLRQKLNCDYFIIMDSEGLRSPELSDSFRHDNEIATLVSCLANTTIINFWGQTFSKDMSDIMQIAAHAYIRMKEVKIKSSFHMIFAGVPDVTAEEKNRLGVGKILDELNSMILKIARDEGRMDIFSGLSSIFPLIQEQLDQIVIPEFLPALWQGSMNPPESRYGEIVQQLKDSICIGLMQQQNQVLRSQPLSEFVNRLTDVWEAIKQENFIFGFKNSQAVEVFGELQKLYDKELAQLRTKFFELSYQQAEQCLRDAAELKDEVEGFRKYSQKVDQFILPQVEFWQDKVVEQLRSQIVQMQDPEMAASHLSTFSFDMKKKVLTWLEREKMNTRDKIVAICRKERNAPMKREQFRKKCLLKAREVAGVLKGGRDSTTLSTTVVEGAFEEIFTCWIQEAQFEDNDLMNSTLNLFSQIWNDSINLLIEKLNLLHPKSEAALHDMISKHFISIKDANEDDPALFNISLKPENDLNCTANWLKSQIKKFLPNHWEKPLQQAKKKRNAIIKRTRDIIQNCKRKATSHFSYVAVIAEILHSTFEDLSGPAADDFEFSKTFKNTVLIRIFGASVKKMAALQMDHIQKSSIAAYLQSKKSDMFKEFLTECQTADSDARAGMRLIKNILCPIIVEQIKLTIGSTVFDAVIAKHQFIQKNNMMFYILKELLTADFEDVRYYVQNYRSYVKTWILAQVTSHCATENFLEACISDKIKTIILSISDVLRNIADDACHTQMSLSSWWSSVNEKLKALGLIYQQSMEEVVTELQDIQDFSYISGQIVNIISEESFEEDTFKLVIQTATDQSHYELDCDEAITQVLDWLVVKPFTALEEQRMGCTAQCPFCGAVCAGGVGCQVEGSASQKHRAEIHMPQGINGYRYEKLGNPAMDDRLVSNICTSMISGNSKFKLNSANKLKYGVNHDNYILYADANNLFYDWHIHALPQASATAFWQYLFVKYQSEFARFYGAQEAGDIPRGWRSVTAKDAIKSLREIYTIHEEQVSDSEEDVEDPERICIVCLVNRKDKFCFTPCGHSNFCRPCATQIIARRDPCPTCRTPIERMQEIYD